MNYFIMRKNDPIALAEFSEDGSMRRYTQKLANPELAPLQSKSSSSWLRDWWKIRAIPIGQGKIASMLAQKGLLGPEEYLLKNLGLSLTDYYWIKPVNSDLTWEDVNLFDNNFSENLLFTNPESSSTPAYAPNSTLQGQLEKTWAIDANGDRILIKGNRDNLSSESINEVIATELHRLQGYDNYTPYELIRIKNKNYDYGCCSKLFTSQKLELISAYAAVTSEKQPNGTSSYEHFISVCEKHGMDIKQLRKDMEYQFMTDFILSGRDRHLNNISILRDADTLQFLRLAPIYDSGKCLFVHTSVPASEKELLSIETQSFASNELKLLSCVTDRSLVDASKLPDPDYIHAMYEKDSQIDSKRIDQITEGYVKKVELFKAFQGGENLKKRIIPGKGNKNANTAAKAEIYSFPVENIQNASGGKKLIPSGIINNGRPGWIVLESSDIYWNPTNLRQTVDISTDKQYDIAYFDESKKLTNIQKVSGQKIKETRQSLLQQANRIRTDRVAKNICKPDIKEKDTDVPDFT